MHRKRRRTRADSQDEVRVQARRSAARTPETAHALRRVTAGRGTANDVFALQRTIGNIAVQRALANRNGSPTVMRNGDEAPTETPADNPFFAANVPKQLFDTFTEMLNQMQEASVAEAASQVTQMFKQLDAAQELAEKTRATAEQEAAEQIVAAIASAATAAVVVSSALSTEVESSQKRQLLDAAMHTTSGLPLMAGITSALAKTSSAIETGKIDAEAKLLEAFKDLTDEVMKKSEESLEEAHKDVALAVEQMQKMLENFDSVTAKRHQG